MSYNYTFNTRPCRLRPDQPVEVQYTDGTNDLVRFDMLTPTNNTKLDEILTILRKHDQLIEEILDDNDQS